MQTEVFNASIITLSEAETVRMPSDKKIKVEVTVRNAGSRLYGHFYLDVFYADTLPDPEDDPADTYILWLLKDEAHDKRYIYEHTLEAGATETWSGESPVAASTWSEGTKIDVGIVLRYGDPLGREIHYLDVLKIADAVEIVAPTQMGVAEAALSKAQALIFR